MGYLYVLFDLVCIRQKITVITVTELHLQDRRRPELCICIFTGLVLARHGHGTHQLRLNSIHLRKTDLDNMFEIILREKMNNFMKMLFPVSRFIMLLARCPMATDSGPTRSICL